MVYFDKILVANRGEIAVRIIRTARDLGIKTVAIYSDADSDALHVKLADEKFRVGPPEPKLSYLNMDAIIRAALERGAEAVHPGYGFLSQNAAFAEKVIESGLTWVGPPPSILRLAGDKLAARRFFSSRGIPVVPGTFEPVSLDDAPSVAEEVGYPVIVKPAGGGGGIGMFVARSAAELKESIERASKLASSAFARGEVYVERYMPRVKHIEVQILGDTHGKVLHLYERECSVQRRFQKVVEEAPSPSITPEEREKVLAFAVKAAENLGYVNAGTFEFIFDLDERAFYLLEVNTRIQVEHPVTEMITGVDIVELQLAVAAGEHLPSELSELEPRGHAIEARVYAEDPANNFAPSPGQISSLHIPSGPWIRVDTGVYEGFRISEHYDPLMMKVIAWGSSREAARRRLDRALEELRISGVKTNRLFLLNIIRHEEFISGTYTTRFSEREELYRGLAEESPSEGVERKVAQKEAGETQRVSYWRLLARAHA